MGGTFNKRKRSLDTAIETDEEGDNSSAARDRPVLRKRKRSRDEAFGNAEEVPARNPAASRESPPDKRTKTHSRLVDEPLKIAAFNIQIFGDRKVGQSDVLSTLVKIISRYDLVLVQEVRDRDKTSIDTLLQNLNRFDSSDPFSCVESERLGRSNCKEQYVFLYRTSRLSVTSTYQYDDGVDNGADAFQREPFAVRFKSPSTEIEDFAIIAVHTDPDDAVKEIGALHKVYDVTKAHWKLEDILIAGDFNADEGYVNQDDWAKIKLRTDSRFKWMIDDETDTTVGNTDRAYDRFVVVGTKLLKAIVPGSAKVYRFDEDLHLTKEQAEDVSDHYPIEIQLYGKVDESVARNSCTGVAVVIQQLTEVANVNDVRKIYRANAPAETAGFEVLLLREHTSMYEVQATKRNLNAVGVIPALREFQEAFPDVITNETICMASAYMQSSLMTSPVPVYGLIKQKRDSFDVRVTASLREPFLCGVTITKNVT